MLTLMFCWDQLLPMEEELKCQISETLTSNRYCKRQDKEKNGQRPWDKLVAHKVKKRLDICQRKQKSCQNWTEWLHTCCLWSTGRFKREASTDSLESCGRGFLSKRCSTSLNCTYASWLSSGVKDETGAESSKRQSPMAEESIVWLIVSLHYYYCCHIKFFLLSLVSHYQFKLQVHESCEGGQRCIMDMIYFQVRIEGLAWGLRGVWRGGLAGFVGVMWAFFGLFSLGLAWTWSPPPEVKKTIFF